MAAATLSFYLLNHRIQSSC